MQTNHALPRHIAPLWKRIIQVTILLLITWCVFLNTNGQPAAEINKRGEISSHRGNIEVTFQSLMDGPYSIPQDDPKLIEVIRNEFLKPPSKLEYNLQNPDVKDPSHWQASEIAKILHNKKNGFFVECGAFDGEFYSNSLYFERYYGWKGILLEPDPIHFSNLTSKNRKSWTAQVCLSPNTSPNRVLFQRNGVGSAIAQYSVQKKKTDFVTVQCFPLYSMLLAVNVTKIDYFSLDVEAVEFDVLKSIPWDKVNITTISVEVQFLGEKKKDLVRYMRKLGYKLFTNYSTIRFDRIDYIFYHPGLLT